MESPEDRRSIDRAIHQTLAVVMAGGRGTRLGKLTATQSKPAVPFGGKYRIIDFTLSNCINSGIHRICVLTQYKAHSLMQHIERGWSFFRNEFGEFLEILPAQERDDKSFWYQGTADAVYQNLDIILEHRPSFVLILAGDHIYKMDYGMMVATHLDKTADVTVGCIEVSLDEAHNFGLMMIDNEYRVIGFQEKPENPVPMPGRDNIALASMGIYLVAVDFLVEVLKKDADNPDSSHDFGRDILPAIYKAHRLVACPFNNLQTGEQAYWRDVGTIDSYWEANIELTGVTPPLNLYDQDWPIWTYQAQLPPAKFVFDNEDRRGMAIDSVVSGGCIVSGSSIRHSLLSSRVRVNSYSRIEDSVLLPGVVVGRNCTIRKAIIESECHIPKNTIIGEDAGHDRARFHVTDNGVVLVCQDMLD
ncbi:MAG: glucose-1-phosphate adenylyltransferase [Gammaproteobacteria bacterium]